MLQSMTIKDKNNACLVIRGILDDMFLSIEEKFKTIDVVSRPKG